jgi:RND family efflux transporter MFP subunit
MSERDPRPADLSALRIDAAARGRRGRHRRWLALGATALGVVVVFLAAGAVKNNRVPVDVAGAREAGGERGLSVLTASGYVTPRERATVAAKVTGRVSEMLVEEGMRVERGQVLARLDDAEARAALRAAEAQRDVAAKALAELQVHLADAERTLRRVEDLRRKEVAAEQDLDSARAAVDALKARIELAKEQVRSAEAGIAVAEEYLKNCVIRAPFAGVAVSKDAQVGEIVSPVSAGGGYTRTGISTIVNMASLEVELDVNESYLSRVAVGQPADAVLDAYPDWHIPAVVRTIIPTADRQKATVKVRIAFDALDPRILPDMGVKVAFLDPAAGGSGGARCLVPLQALMDDGGEPVVWVVQGGLLERHPVKAGRTIGREVEILSGVEPGDTVVIAAAKPLKPGRKAEVKK